MKNLCIITFCLIAIFLSSCGPTEIEDPILGTWQERSYSTVPIQEGFDHLYREDVIPIQKDTLVFRGDGTFDRYLPWNLGLAEGEWELTEDSLRLIFFRGADEFNYRVNALREEHMVLQKTSESLLFQPEQYEEYQALGIYDGENWTVDLDSLLEADGNRVDVKTTYKYDKQ